MRQRGADQREGPGGASPKGDQALDLFFGHFQAGKRPPFPAIFRPEKDPPQGALSLS